MNAGLQARYGPLLRTACRVVATALCYYLATQIAWALCFPDSKVSLFFPPHAVLTAILLLVPTRHWWAYTLAAASAHFIATQQAQWPTLYALHCEVFDAVQNVAAAAGIRLLIKSPLKALTLRDVIFFVLIAVALVPFGTAFWGAAFTVSNGFGTHYWIEWRNLGISNAVTSIVLVPAFLLGVHHLFVKWPKAPSRRRVLEAAIVGACTVAVGIFVFDRSPAGPAASPPLLYTCIPLLIWAALRFGLGGLSLSMLIITFLAIWGTMRGHGPFLLQTPAENALALQLFLLMTATPLTLLAVVIEEEKRSEESLREHKDLLGLVAEAANAAIWMWDVSNNVWWMTAHARALFGIKPGAKFDLAALLDRVHVEDRAAREHAITRALNSRGEFDAEYRVQHPDGTIHWFHGRGRCVEADDRTGPILFGVSMDVTVRKQAEALAAHERQEHQQQRAQLEHVARVATLGELTANLTHELKQPLSAIAMGSSLGIEYLNAPQPNLQDLRQTFSRIGDVTRRAIDMIQGMRDMLKHDTPGFTNLDLNHLIRTVNQITYGDAILHGVSVDVELSPRMALVNGDSVQLQQVIMNLMLNAFSAMSQLEPDTRRLLLSTKSIGENVIVQVRDSGMGIPKQKLERIFDPFVTTKPDGLGLGLSICRTIIERHGGIIWAANNPDRGATFSFTLPATRQ